MIISVWDNNIDDYVKFNFKPTVEDIKSYEDSLTNKDLLTFLMPYCGASGDFYSYLNQENSNLDLKNKNDVYSLFQSNPEGFRQIAIKYLMYGCRQKPLTDDMIEFFKTFAEIKLDNNEVM